MPLGMIKFLFITACSRDGSARLWDCGEAKCLAVVSKSDCPVNSCALMQLQEMKNGASDILHSKKINNHCIFKAGKQV